MVDNVPTQGDIIMMNLNPRLGHEQQNYRPYICLSNKLISDTANIAVFAPISRTNRAYPFYYELKEAKTSGKVLIDQLIAVDYNARPFTYVETLGAEKIKDILTRAKFIFDENEKTHLD